MATIGKLNYIISANTTAFVRGMVASRTEAALQKKILEQMRSPLDDWSAAQAKLVGMMKTGKLAKDQYRFAMEKLVAQHPQRIAQLNAEAEAERRLAEASKQSAATRQRVREITLSLNPAMNAYRQQVAELNALQRRGAIDLGTYQAKMQQLVADVRQASPVFGSFWKLQYQHPYLTVAAAALAAQRAVSAFATAVLSTMRNVGELAGQSQQLGMSLGSMAQLSRAAQMANVDTRQLADGMLELQKRGADPSLTPTQQLLAAVYQIRKLKTGTEQTAAAMEAFGEKGKELLPVIRMNQADYQAWVRVLGQPLAGDAGLQKIQAANLAVKELSFAWENVWTIVAAELAPEIVSFSAQLRTLLSDGERLQTISDVFRNLAGAADLAMGAIEAGAWVMARFTDAQQGLVALVHTLMAGYYKLRAALSSMSGDAAGSNTWTQFAREEMRSIQREMAATQQAAATTRDAVIAASAGPIRAATTPGIVRPSEETAAGAGKSLQAETNELVDSLQQQMDWAGRTADEVTRLKLAARGLGPEWLRVVAAMQQRSAVAQQAAEARAEVERLNAALREQIGTARMAASGWSTDQIEAWKLAQRGAGAEQLQQLALLQQQAAAWKNQQDQQAQATAKQQELQTTLKETKKRLADQIATAGMSPAEIELYRLKDQGASREQLAQVAMLQQQAATLGNRDLATPSVMSSGTLAGTREAAERIAAYRDREAKAGSEKTPWDKQLSLQERIAKTLDRILGVSGLTVEEAS